MLLELATPAILPLALAAVEKNGRRKPGLLGLTLQHPLSHTLMYRSSQLQITGARAHIGHKYCQAFLEHSSLPLCGTVELEHATPSHMGLGSDAMIGLTMARGLIWAQDLPPDGTPAWYRALGLNTVDALALHAFDQGGLLIADLEEHGNEPPGLLIRVEIEHEKRDQDWIFVLFLPRVPSDTSDNLEIDLLTDLLAAQSTISPERLAAASDALLSAAEADDITTFASAVMDIQKLNLEGLEHAGNPRPYSENEKQVLKIMQENGALAWGRSAAGMALFGLIQGGKASVGLRAVLRREIGFDKGLTLATIVDNHGSRSMVHEEDVENAKQQIFNFHRGILSRNIE